MWCRSGTGAQLVRPRGGSQRGAAGADAGQNADHGLVVVFRLVQYTIEINKLLWRNFKMLVPLCTMPGSAH